MNSMILTLLLVFSAAVTASGQITIYQGTSLLFSFNSLDFLSSSTSLVSVAEARLFGLPGVLTSGESIQMDFFPASDGAGAPYFTASFTATIPGGTYADAIGFYVPSTAWDDLDGSVRVTALSGDASIQYIRFQVNRPGETFAQIQVVPEPRVWTLLTLGSAVLLLTNRRRRLASRIGTGPPR